LCGAVEIAEIASKQFHGAEPWRTVESSGIDALDFSVDDFGFLEDVDDLVEQFGKAPKVFDRIVAPGFDPIGIGLPLLGIGVLQRLASRLFDPRVFASFTDKL
jgi:hypothetical protein